MKRRLLTCTVIILLVTSVVEAQNFDDWLGTWDVEMYYQVFLLEEPMIWIIDNATDRAAFGIDQASGADIIITWDDASQKYVFAAFQITLSEDSFQGYLENTRDITIRGESRPSPADDGEADGPDNVCPVSMLIKDNNHATKILQNFRDEFLIPTPTGRMLVNLYYNNTKMLYELVNADEHLRHVCRMLLLSAMPLIEQMCRYGKHL